MCRAGGTAPQTPHLGGADPEGGPGCQILRKSAKKWGFVKKLCVKYFKQGQGSVQMTWLWGLITLLNRKIETNPYIYMSKSNISKMAEEKWAPKQGWEL